MTDRRTFMKASAGIAAAMAIGSPAVVRAQALEAITIITPFGFIGSFIEMMNAKAGGHFAKQGLDVTIIGGQGQAQANQQLVASDIVFSRSSALDQMRAIAAANAPLVSFATLYQASTFHMISLKQKPIASAEDLKGKTVGIVSIGGTTDILLEMILHKAGLKRDDLKVEVTGNSPGALQLVKQGRIDGFMASMTAIYPLQVANEPIELWSTDRYAPAPSQCYLTTRQMIEKRPETLLKVTKAMKASVEEILQGDMVAIFQRAAKMYDIPGMQGIETVAKVAKLESTKLWLSEGQENLMRNVPALWQSGADAMREAGLADIKDVKAIYTNRFVDAA